MYTSAQSEDKELLDLPSLDCLIREQINWLNWIIKLSNLHSLQPCILYFISLSAHKEIKYLGDYLTRLCGTTFGSTLWYVRAPCRENDSIYWSFLTLSHMEKPQCNRFQIQIRSTCVSCSHMAANLRKQQFVSPSHCTTSNFRKEKKKKSALRQTDGRGCAGLGRVVLGWVGLGAGCARFPLPSVGAQTCAELSRVEARVSQAVSGSCDQKLSAQQLETTYVTRLRQGSAKSSQGRRSGWNLGKHFKG